ncbi:MAG: hypothetical protein AAFU85_08025 [Planctomycetota bacterium]
MVRFDGQELVLGAGDCQSTPVATLRDAVSDLRGRERHRSAAESIRLRRRAASRWVMESVKQPNDLLSWAAETLDRNSSTPLHTQLIDAAAKNPQAARAFDTARRESMQAIANGSSTPAALEQLARATTQLNTPLATLEAERLFAMSEIAEGQLGGAATRLVSAAEFAAREGSADQCAQLWLLASETLLRAEAIDSATAAWQSAVRAQVTAMTQQSRGREGLAPLDTVFWEQVDRLRPPNVALPQEVSLVMNPWKSRIGLGGDQSMSPEASLWSAVAAYELTMGQPQVATLSIKRAEINASDDVKPWLRIALARSVAAQGQTQVATTILGSLTSHADTSVRAASLATLGSIKVQAGAYEQGSRFLFQALSLQDAVPTNQSGTSLGTGQWPGRLAAEADLAIVRLIIGDLNEARDSLHAVQQKLTVRDRWQSLVQSLENEASILELEGDNQAAKQIRKRVLELERHPV